MFIIAGFNPCRNQLLMCVRNFAPGVMLQMGGGDEPAPPPPPGGMGGVQLSLHSNTAPPDAQLLAGVQLGNVTAAKTA
jgi:hypothetical protein